MCCAQFSRIAWQDLLEALRAAERAGEMVVKLPMLRLAEAQDAAWLNPDATARLSPPRAQVRV